MAERSQSTSNDLPEISLQQFLLGLACDPSSDDEVLTAPTLRAILRDYRDHARRLLGEGARHAK